MNLYKINELIVTRRECHMANLLRVYIALNDVDVGNIYRVFRERGGYHAVSGLE
jgi:hypothetical protein